MDLRFAVETPMGRLAKWLRILGFDTLYEQQDVAAGESFERISRNRIRLTRKRQSGSGQIPNQLVIIVSNHYIDQLKEVILALAITAESIQPFTRCIRCNTQIENVSKEAVRGSVPDYVWETHHVFRICRCCNRIYWKGTHIEHSLERVKRIFDFKP